MERDIVIQRSENATFQVVAGEAIVIRMDTGAYYSLNEVGTDFWELLDGHTTLDQHAHTIAAKYEQKTGEFVSRLYELALEGGDAQQLAQEFDVPPELIADNLSSLRGPGADAQAAFLVAEWTVTPEQITSDLMEMTSELLAEKLVEAK